MDALIGDANEKNRPSAKTVIKYIFLAATLIVCVRLCVGSLLPGSTSAASSDNFGAAVDNALSGMGIDKGDVMAGSGTDNWSLFVRKLFGHFGAFLGLGVLASVTFMLFAADTTRSRLLHAGAAAVFGFTFACLTELLQTDLFTTDRGASFYDVITDCRGYFLSALPVLAIWLAVVIGKDIATKRKYGALLDAAADVYGRDPRNDKANNEEE